MSNLIVPRIPSKSPYTLKEKIRMAIWFFVEMVFFRPSLHKMNRYRCALLRLFGAKVGRNTFIHAKAKIWFPWNLCIGSNSGIGFDALIYNLDKVEIGDFATISQRCHLVTGSHDYKRKDFALVTKPIVIKSGVFVGADAYIGLGVTVNEMSVIAARSVVVKDMPEFTVCGGHPCKPIKKFEVLE